MAVAVTNIAAGNSTLNTTQFLIASLTPVDGRNYMLHVFVSGNSTSADLSVGGWGTTAWSSFTNTTLLHAQLKTFVPSTLAAMSTYTVGTITVNSIAGSTMEAYSYLLSEITGLSSSYSFIDFTTGRTTVSTNLVTISNSSWTTSELLYGVFGQRSSVNITTGASCVLVGSTVASGGTAPEKLAILAETKTASTFITAEAPAATTAWAAQVWQLPAAAGGTTHLAESSQVIAMTMSAGLYALHNAAAALHIDMAMTPRLQRILDLAASDHIDMSMTPTLSASKFVSDNMQITMSMAAALYAQHNLLLAAQGAFALTANLYPQHNLSLSGQEAFGLLASLYIQRNLVASLSTSMSMSASLSVVKGIGALLGVAVSVLAGLTDIPSTVTTFQRTARSSQFQGQIDANFYPSSKPPMKANLQLTNSSSPEFREDLNVTTTPYHIDLAPVANTRFVCLLPTATNTSPYRISPDTTEDGIQVSSNQPSLLAVPENTTGVWVRTTVAGSTIPVRMMLL